jgi:hypothetical protein
VKALDDALKSDCICRVCLASILDDYLHRAEEQIAERSQLESAEMATAH